MAKKVIKNPKGFFAYTFNSGGPLGYGPVIIKYKKVGKLGKILSIKKETKVPTPKAMRVSSVNNNSPRAGVVTIVYKKR